MHSEEQLTCKKKKKKKDKKHQEYKSFGRLFGLIY